MMLTTSTSKQVLAVAGAQQGPTEGQQLFMVMVTMPLGLPADRGRQPPGETLNPKTQGGDFGAMSRPAASSVSQLGRREHACVPAVLQTKKHHPQGLAALW